MIGNTPGPSSLSCVQSNNNARKRHKTNVVLFQHLRRSAGRLRAPLRPMHGQKVISAQLLAFPGCRIDQIRPVVLVNSPTLLPLLGSPVTDTDIGSHLATGIPPAEKLVKGFSHNNLVALDRLSSQERTTRPVTGGKAIRTIRPMGKAATPTRFKQTFCAKLKAAREFRGLSQEEMAKRLHILPNTYSKYEKRSLMPHYLLVQASVILDVTPDYFYGFEPVAKVANQ